MQNLRLQSRMEINVIGSREEIRCDQKNFTHSVECKEVTISQNFCEIPLQIPLKEFTFTD
jgi:hypothetical protein